MIKNLQKEERYNIFSLFINNKELKFSEIEKLTKIRSNSLSYHLEQMIKDDILEKVNNNYQLSHGAEKYIPILEQLMNNSSSPLPVVLIALINEKNQILLLKRNKRPYIEHWGLIGGKILFDENHIQASHRLIEKKTNHKADFISLCDISFEKVIDDTDNGITTKQSFILFMTKMQIQNTIELERSNSGELKWFNLDELDSIKIIPSDLWLIRNKLNNKINVKNITMKEGDDSLSEFKIN